MSTIDYSGVSSLAQAVLAVNLAYIGLDRFRYRSAIEKMYKDACEQIKDASTDLQEDLAWKNISRIASGGVKAAWGGRVLGYWCYKYLFVWTLDIVLCVAFTFASVILLAVHAYDALIYDINMTSALAGKVGLTDLAVNWLIFLMLIAGMIVPAALLAAGSHSTRKAKEAMDENLDHLGTRIKTGAEAAANATIKDLVAKIEKKDVDTPPSPE